MSILSNHKNVNIARYNFPKWSSHGAHNPCMAKLLLVILPKLWML